MFSVIDRNRDQCESEAIMPGRDTSRDGLKNKFQGFLLMHGKPFWDLVQAIPPLQRWANGKLIDNAIYKLKTRPHSLSTLTSYTSWDSLTDRTYSGRHLPPKPIPGGPLPPVDDVVELFRRPRGGMRVSEKSTALFPYFAQWFTDGFLRTNRHDSRQNTSNHDIDLSPLYGLDRATTRLIRSGEGGRLRSQVINGEEYPPHYLRDGQVAEEFRTLPEPVRFKVMPDEARRHLFAMGYDRANVQIGYTGLNTLFLREHNRICGELARRNAHWDDERLFQTARNILIVILIKIVIEDYINHIKPYHFDFTLDPPVVGNGRWYRQNWMTVEFNLLYRWHALMPDEVVLDDRTLPMEATFANNRLLTELGLARVFDGASRQPAGEIGPFNTPESVLETEKVSIELGRAVELASYNDYREMSGYPRVTQFDQITGNPKAQRLLKDLYGDVDRVEFYVGLFSEDVRPHSAVAPMIGRLVGVDAFSQALTNPLLAPNIYNKETFTPDGLDLIESTTRLSDVLRRNIPDPDQELFVSMTRDRTKERNPR